MKPGDFPIQANCDPKKADEFATWALVALPRMKGAALPMPSEYMQLVSKHLWDAGFRWHRKYQKIKWRAPAANEPHWLTSPGRWVPINEPDPVDEGLTIVDVLAAMKKADEGGFLDALEELGRRSKGGEKA